MFNEDKQRLFDSIQQGNTHDICKFLDLVQSYEEIETVTKSDIKHIYSLFMAHNNVVRGNILRCISQEEGIRLLGPEIWSFIIKANDQTFEDVFNSTLEAYSIGCGDVYTTVNIVEDHEAFIQAWRRAVLILNTGVPDWIRDFKLIYLGYWSDNVDTEIFYQFLDELCTPLEQNICGKLQTALFSLYVGYPWACGRLIERIKGVKLEFFEVEFDTFLSVLDGVEPGYSFPPDEQIRNGTIQKFFEDHSYLLFSRNHFLSLLLRVRDSCYTTGFSEALSCINIFSSNFAAISNMPNFLLPYIWSYFLLKKYGKRQVLNPILYHIQYSNMHKVLKKLMIIVNPSVYWTVAKDAEKHELTNFLEAHFEYSTWRGNGWKPKECADRLKWILERMCHDFYVLNNIASTLLKLHERWTEEIILSTLFYEHNPYHAPERKTDFLQEVIDIFTKDIIQQPRSLQYLTLRRVQQRLPVDQVMKPVESQAKVLGVPKYLLNVPPIASADSTYCVCEKLTQIAEKYSGY